MEKKNTFYQVTTVGKRTRIFSDLLEACEYEQERAKNFIKRNKLYVVQELADEFDNQFVIERYVTYGYEEDEPKVIVSKITKLVL